MTTSTKESIPVLKFRNSNSKLKNLYYRFKEHNSIPVSETDEKTFFSLKSKLYKETDYKIAHFPDSTYRIVSKSTKIRKPYVFKNPRGNVDKLITLMKSGAKMTIYEIMDYFGSTQAQARSVLGWARKWLAKEGLFISNDGNGNTIGKYKLMQEEDVSAESSRRYNLIGTHFNNVQNLITSGMEQYGDNPEITSHLENLILNIQEQQISHRRRLLTK